MPGKYGFEVDTQLLKDSAKAIEDYKTTYEKSYRTMYDEVDDLHVKWEGTSSDAFNTALNEAKSDYEDLVRALGEYIENLNTIASNYEKTESDITSNANGLR